MRLETPCEVKTEQARILRHELQQAILVELLLTGNCYLANMQLVPLPVDPVSRTITVRMTGDVVTRPKDPL